MSKNHIVPPDLTPAQLAAKSRKFKKASSEQRVEIVKVVRAKKEKRGKVSQATVTAVVKNHVPAKTFAFTGALPALPPLRELTETHTTLVTVKDGKRLAARVPVMEHAIRTEYTPAQLARYAADIHEINRRHGPEKAINCTGAAFLAHEGWITATVHGWEASDKARLTLREAVKHLTANKVSTTAPGVKPRTSGKFPVEMTIKALSEKNPSREGTKAYGFYELIRKGGTVAAYVAAGGSQNYLVWFADRGLVEVK